MALSGIQIFKLLPKTNCKECGHPTCLAFAMALAAAKIELAACPYVTDEAKAQLAEDSAPPIRTVEIGTGDWAFKTGGETVLFRHEKTFVNPTALAVLVCDDEDEASVDGKLKRLNELQYDRVGLTLRANAVAVKAHSGDGAKFGAFVEKVKGATPAALILIADDVGVMAEGVKVAKDRKPLLFAATADNADAMGALAKENGLPLAIKGKDLDETAALAEKLTAAGLKDLVLDPGSRDIKQALQDSIVIRRAAIQKKFRPLGFPTITFPLEMTEDFMEEELFASLLMAKYAGIIVLSDLRGQNLFPLLLERLNVFTDPQRPMRTEQGIYEMSNPIADSPILCTSNFSLTYFIVSGEIENSRVPANLAVLDTEGLSVLTAWAAGKFAGDVLGAFLKKSGIGEKSSKKVIIPGYAAVISGDLEEELGSDWEVMIGPREASSIPAYLKEHFA